MDAAEPSASVEGSFFDAKGNERMRVFGKWRAERASKVPNELQRRPKESSANAVECFGRNETKGSESEKDCKKTKKKIKKALTKALKFDKITKLTRAAEPPGWH